MQNKLYKKSVLTVLAIVLMFSFIATISALAAGPASVNLGTAGDFVVLAKSGISTTGSTSITGDIGVSPIAATAITGFGLIMDSSNTFSTSALINGKVYATDYTNPTPTKMTTAVSNMETAYTDAAGRANPTATELGAGNIGGMTLAPGLYKWSTNVTIPSNVTLSGGANDVWIFQIAGNLNISSATQIVLNGGAQAANIFWQVAGQTTIGTTAVFNGNILDQTAIVINTGAVLNGQALAQTMVTLDSNTVTKPTLIVSTPTPVSTPVVTPVSTPTTNPVPTNSSPAPTLIPSITNPSTPSGSSPTLLTPLSLTTTNSTLTTVVVTPPKFPNTGTSSENNNNPWSSIIIAVFVASTSLYLVQKSKHLGSNR